MVKIGVISDTHDFLDPRIPEIFKGVDHILHGGDVGLPWLPMDLREIAPLTLVAGNTDDPSLRYPLTMVVEIARVKFLLHHIVNPRDVEDELAGRIRREKPRVVIFGHTHKPFAEEIGGVLFFNPGYAGRQRFSLERSVAIIQLEREEITFRYVSLK